MPDLDTDLRDLRRAYLRGQIIRNVGWIIVDVVVIGLCVYSIIYRGM